MSLPELLDVEFVELVEFEELVELLELFVVFVLDVVVVVVELVEFEAVLVALLAEVVFDDIAKVYYPPRVLSIPLFELGIDYLKY